MPFGLFCYESVFLRLQSADFQFLCPHAILVGLWCSVRVASVLADVFTFERSVKQHLEGLYHRRHSCCPPPLGYGEYVAPQQL